MMTEYNPNYEFAGGTCTLQDLREVDRDNLILVKYVTFVTFAFIIMFIVQGSRPRSLWGGVSRNAEE